MSEATIIGDVPGWDLADRMRKALRHADVGVQEMADYLGVGRNTVSTWINGRITPSRQTQRLWALRCGVDFRWLETGLAKGEAVASVAADDRLEKLPRLDSNQQPAGFRSPGYRPATRNRAA